MTSVNISKTNEVYIKVDTDRSTLMGMNEYFARYAKDYQFQPKYKARIWDGKIRFLSYSTGLIYAGLIKDVIAYCEDWGIKVTVEKEVRQMFQSNFSDLDSYFSELELSAHGGRIEYRDYQLKAIKSALSMKRRLIQSPTSSGKSSIIYGIVRYLEEKVLEEKEGILIVVPTIGLVTQLRNDFKDYSTLNGWDVDDLIGTSTDKKNPNQNAKVFITTWQSVYKNEPEWFDRFRCLIVDEAHQATANSLVKIGRMCNAEFRFGLSGSINSEDEASEMTLRGLFGFKMVAVTTKELMEEGTVSQLQVNCIHYKHPEGVEVERDYHLEIEYLAGCEERNRYILKKANELEGNVLVLFTLVEKHGKILHEMAQGLDKEVFFVYGGTDAEQRENVRGIVEKHEGCIILASYATFSTGVNIRNIRHIIFASPTKSFSRVIQSIGRGLRTSKTKNRCDVWDVFDEIYGNQKNPNSMNYTFKHFLERVKIYIKEGFRYTVEEVKG